MKHYYLLLLALLLAGPAAAQSVGIGTTAPDASAALDIVSSSKGALLPRVADATALASPATGLIVYQTGGTAGYYYYDGTAWQQLVPAGSNSFVRNQTSQQTGANFNIDGNGTVGGRLGVGTNTPLAGLHVTTGSNGIGGSTPGGAGAILSGLPGSSPFLELRGSGTNASDNAYPYLDFAENNTVDYSTRLISSVGTLFVTGPTSGQLLFVQGRATVSGAATLSGGATITGTTSLNATGTGTTSIGTGGGPVTLGSSGSAVKVASLAAGSVVTTDASGNLATSTAASLDPTTASNGLTKTGSNFTLGGTLTQATTLAQAGNFLALTGGKVGINTTSALGINPRLSVLAGDPTEPGLEIDLASNSTVPSLKLEHIGSNLIVRPATAGGTSTIVENTGGGGLLLNPTGGNVGIGTTNALGRLTVSRGPLLLTNPAVGNADPRPVVGTARLAGEIGSVGYAGGDNSVLPADDGFLRLSAGGGYGANSKSYIDLTGYSSVPDMYQNIVLGTSGTERLRLTSDGNLGLGINTPTALLDVNGAARVRGLGAGVVTADASGNLSSSSATTAFGTSFIQNTTGQQANSNFNIDGSGTVGNGLTVSGGATVTGATSINATGGGTTTIGNTGNTFIGYGTGSNNYVGYGSLSFNYVGSGNASNNYVGSGFNSGNYIGSGNYSYNYLGYGSNSYNFVGYGGSSNNYIGSGSSSVNYVGYGNAATTYIGTGNYGGIVSGPVYIGHSGGTVKVQNLGAGVVQAAADGTLSSTPAATFNASFIDNQTTQQTGASFNISGNGTVGSLTAGTATVAGAITGTGASIAGTGVGVRADGGLNIGQSSNNIFLGYNSGNGVSSANNVFVGIGSGGNISGASNVVIGNNSGGTTSGYSNTVLGSGSTISSSLSGSVANATAVGAGVTLTTSNTVVLGNGASVGIGTSTPSALLDVNGAARVRGLGAGVVTTDASGNLSSSSATTAFGTSFIQNTTTQQAGSNFNISGNGTVGGLLGVGTGTNTPAGGLQVTTGNGGVGANATGGAGAILSGMAGSPPNLELRGSSVTTPYIDFAEDNTVDFSTRLLSQNGTLNVSGTTTGTLLQVNGNTGISGTATVTGNTTIGGSAAIGGGASITGNTVVDATGANTGTASNFLRFGSSTSGEGMGSQRSGSTGNVNGLDLYTVSTPRLSITSGGNVGVGTNTTGGIGPVARLAVQVAGDANRGLQVTSTQNGTASATNQPLGNIVLQPLSGANDGFMTLAFNGYYNAGEQQFNTSKNRWRMVVDQRGSTDALSIDAYKASDNPAAKTILSAAPDGTLRLPKLGDGSSTRLVTAASDGTLGTSTAANLGLATTASNGLTRNGNDIQLGGSLTQNTTILTGTSSLNASLVVLTGTAATDQDDFTSIFAATGRPSLYQTFQPGVSSYLTAVTLKLYNSGNPPAPVLTVRAGSGLGGAVLGTATLGTPVTNSTLAYTFSFSGVALTAGQPYTLQLEAYQDNNNNVAWYTNDNSGYANGYAGYGNTLLPAGTDFQFQTTMQAGTAKPELTVSNSRVGVGTGSPGHPLAVQADGSNRLLGFNDNTGTDKFNFSLAGGGLNLSESNVAGGRLFVQSSTGYVGVGTTNPGVPLDVQFSNGNYTVNNYGYLAQSGAGGNVSSSGPQSVSIRASGRMVASEFDAVSDLRLKRVVGLSSGAADLTLLNQLRITDYTMRDRVAFGDRKFKKVIAQEVEAVYPQAVQQHAGFLPDVYAPATAVRPLPGDSLVVVELPAGLPVAATTGQRLRLLAPAGEVLAALVAPAPAGTTRLTLRRAAALAGADKAVFVYGFEHADVRAVDYEALSMLNVSATQELARQVAELQKQNATLQVKATQAEADHADLQTMKEELARLREAVVPTVQAQR